MKLYQAICHKNTVLCEVEAPNKTEARRVAYVKLQPYMKAYQSHDFNMRVSSMKMVEVK